MDPFLFMRKFKNSSKGANWISNKNKKLYSKYESDKPIRRIYYPTPKTPIKKHSKHFFKYPEVIPKTPKKSNKYVIGYQQDGWVLTDQSDGEWPGYRFIPPKLT